MAMIESWFQQDLKKPVQVRTIGGNVFSADNQGNLIGVAVTDNGAAAALSGTVYANMIRADGQTVTQTGTLSGNRCSVVLPAAAYAVPGTLMIALKLTNGTEITTLLAVAATVYRTSTDAAVDPGTIIPSIDDLIAAIDEAVDSIPPDYSALVETVTGIDDSIGNAGIETAEWESGYFDLSGSSVDISSRTSSSSYVSCVFPCEPGDVFVVTSEGASSARNWGLLSGASGTGNVVSKKTSPFTSDNEILVAYADSAYAVFNAKKSEAYTVVKTNIYRDLLSLRHAYAQYVESGSDFNDFTAPGSYRVTSAAVAASLLHCPSNYAGRLTTIALNSENSVFQIYISTEGELFCRMRASGAWKAWEYLNGPVVQLGHYYTKQVAENADFDSYTTPGNYRVPSVAIANTVSNIPERVSGRLTVITLAGAGSLHQWYIAASNNWYIRELIGGAWSGWKRLVDEDAIASDGGNASRGAYNAMQPIIRSAPYNLAFANAFTPIGLKNYMGNTQNVHPKVLYFSGGFGGHKWWMAYTPYPYSNDDYENPCVAYSDDGVKWTDLDGNPLSDPQGNGYNSDTHLVYRSDTGALECWYRYVGPASQSPREETIYRRSTTDGVTWTAEEQVYSNTSGNYAQLLSPAVEFDGTNYQIWVVVSANPMRIDYYTAPASNIGNWTLVRSFTLSFTDGGTTVQPWHLDVIRDGGRYVMLVMCRNSTSVSTAKCSLFITTSEDNITYTTPERVVCGADNWDRYMYRSSIVKAGNKYLIYYSAGSGGTQTIYNKAVWGIGITESDSLEEFYGMYE